ncbi:MAG: hypothetical protein JNN07_12345 [Verrucomicrobiales bacterium]|nr:hypothetical protein [Verrucomicrobiales bacterium]
MKQKRIIIGLASIVAALAAWGVIAYPFRYSSVCDRCGEVRHTTEWMLPFSDFTLLSHSAQSNSVLAHTLSANGIIQPHPHHWLFSAGGGHGVRCAIGPGRHIMGVVNSEEFASVVVRIHAYGLIGISDRILRGALDPSTSRTFSMLALGVPKEPTTVVAVESWFTEESKYIPELERRTETGTTTGISPNERSTATQSSP